MVLYFIAEIPLKKDLQTGNTLLLPLIQGLNFISILQFSLLGGYLYF